MGHKCERPKGDEQGCKSKVGQHRPWGYCTRKLPQSSEQGIYLVTEYEKQG